MTLEDLARLLPEYAKDLKLNLGSLLRETALTPQQRDGTLLVTALASRNPHVIRAVEGSVALSPEASSAARAAASIMAMNNVYYRFTHLVSDQEYAKLPARLRMSVIGRPGVDRADFELWCLAVSAINGCGACMDSHEQVLRKADVSREAIQLAVRIAAVVHAVAATLDGELAVARDAAA